MKNPNYSRRKFINKCLTTSGLVLGGAFILNSCNTNQPGEEPAAKKENNAEDSCNDLSGVSEGELKKRESLGYVTKSPNPDNECGNCSLFIPPKKEMVCGGCLLFKGPVYKEGHCVQWAAIV